MESKFYKGKLREGEGKGRIRKETKFPLIHTSNGLFERKRKNCREYGQRVASKAPTCQGKNATRGLKRRKRKGGELRAKKQFVAKSADNIIHDGEREVTYASPLTTTRDRGLKKIVQSLRTTEIG